MGVQLSGKDVKKFARLQGMMSDQRLQIKGSLFRQTRF